MPKTQTEGVGIGKVKYADPSYGPFNCEHCQWFSRVVNSPNGPGRCHHPEVLETPQIPKDATGLSIVEAKGCCNEFRPTRRLSDVKFSDAGI